ncbi:p-hydroxylaminobenzoate lyase [Biscogniauxia mediterranea]|nr:p-hydroxylaminobenzoate lyase [Biscogniauxia mediterranea]
MIMDGGGAAEPGQAAVLDLSKYPTAQKLVQRCCEFFEEVEDLTPGQALEERLNRDYGPGSDTYSALSAYARQGLAEGWLAPTEIGVGRAYRRGKIALPDASTRFFSITAVYMDSTSSTSSPSSSSSSGSKKQEQEPLLTGQYHAHPYGEINCVIPVEVEEKGEGAELEGMAGWRGAGWTSPGPGTHHYPRVRGGALVALFFLPAGRISYKATPDMAQPLSV